MLFNPDWKKPETKPDVFSLASLIRWLEKQPADRAYDYHDIFGCIVCQYLDAMCETPWPERGRFSKVFSSIDQYHAVAAAMPWTFGAALARARACLVSTSQRANPPDA